VKAESFAPTLALIGMTALLAACTTTGDGLFSGEKVDYRSTAIKAQPLEVPPDLTQLARESRYQPQGGVISAAAAGAAPAANAASAPVVALNSLGDMRVQRDGNKRWLVVPQTPEQLWPRLKTFWQERGFTLAEENAATGVMETNFSENRARLPNDVVRNTIGRLLGNLYDTGERDSYRTRLERTAAGTEIYISHRGIEEVKTSDARDSGTTWRARATEPELEAELLSRLMVTLGSEAAPARAAVAAAGPASAAAGPAPQAVVAAQATSLSIAEPFDRAWRRLGVALDRSGFTVEDRDRSAGIYYVRYVDPKSAGKEEPGFWSRLFGNDKNPLAALRYRVVVKSAAGQSEITVQSSAGNPETGDNAKAIIGRLAQELR
jgi:outer membrane protein assembly factor BamC